MPESNIQNSHKPDSRYRIEVIDHAGDHSLETRIAAAVQSVLLGSAVPRGEISVALVDDPAIHRLNRDFLQHDWPTDVITFPGDDPINVGSEEAGQRPDAVFGEIIISLDTAGRVAAELGTSLESEAVLYAIHGTLHLTGLDDHDDADQAEMRAAEQKYMELAGFPEIGRPSDQVSGS